MEISEFARELSSLIPEEKIMGAASEADINGDSFLVFGFRPESSSFIIDTNLIVKYIPLRDEVLWGRIEFVISPGIEAVSFMEKVYPKLISMGFEIVVESEGIYAYYKLGQEISGSLIKRLYERLCGMLGDRCGTLLFRGVTTVGEG